MCSHWRVCGSCGPSFRQCGGSSCGSCGSSGPPLCGGGCCDSSIPCCGPHNPPNGAPCLVPCSPSPATCAPPMAESGIPDPRVWNAWNTPMTYPCGF